MARRRGTGTSLGPPDLQLGQPGASPGGSLASSRSVSPSGGFTQFLSRPTKWFNRSSSTGTTRPSGPPSEPRSSTSSAGRKHKISHPTDPRPILDTIAAESRGAIAMGIGSRSVLDLSLTHDMNERRPGGPRTPSSPSQPSISGGLGDLRGISRKPWSKSADDLGKMSSLPPLSPLTPIDMTFQSKVEQYRSNRSDSLGSMQTLPSPGSAAHPSPQKNLPFPIITTTEPLSTSPPSSVSMQAPYSASSASGGSLAPAGQGAGTHAHVRSHSFTPRLPSKLANPKALAPPSPKRKDSGSSERELDRERGKSTSGGSSMSSPSKLPFSLGLGGSVPKVSSPFNTLQADPFSNLPSPPAHLMPPTIVEPGGDASSAKEKRTSQLVHGSGFVNRLVDFNPSSLNTRATYSYLSGGPATSLSKGWKPFKLVLKGSKLYFYKPPSDRSAAVKELFPTELVAVLEDENEGGDVPPDDEGEELHGRGKGRERGDTQRRRAYWGRNTHPALILSNGKVVRGTLEALVHEAVFATTFIARAAGSEDASQQSPGTPRYRPEWQEFSATILLALPCTVDRQQFETEFSRCCSYLLEGSEPDVKDEARGRVRWLASQYIDYHGQPANTSSWDKWREETLPDFPSGAGVSSKVAGIPQSLSTQAMYAPTPQLGDIPPTQDQSPNLVTFSPRPGADSKILSLMDALAEPNADGRSSITLDRMATSTSRAWHETVQREGLTREVLLGLDLHLVASSLTYFHRKLLEDVSDNICVDACLELEADDTVDSAAASSVSAGLSPFCGSDDHPHWLTRLVLTQILVPESLTSRSATLSSIADIQTSRTHSRSEIVSAWIKIGELCRKAGDECSWRAIMAAVCSRPVARLEKVWRRVDAEALSYIHSWLRPDGTGEATHVGEPKVTPWAGDIRNRFRESLETARSPEGDEWNFSVLEEVRKTFEHFRTDLSLCYRSTAEESAELNLMVGQWATHLQGDRSKAVASKFVTVKQFMSLSLAAEPKRKGLFEPYYWTRSQSQQVNHSLAAILFPEPLPTTSLIDRDIVVRGRFESNASTLNMQELQQLREIRPKDSYDGPDVLKSGALDLGGTMLPVYNGELLLLVQPGADKPPSRASSRAPSRPPSSTVESVGEKTTVSRNPSIRVTPGSSHTLERKTSSSMLRRNSLPSLSQRANVVTSEINSERPLRVVVQAGTLDRLVDVLIHGLQGVSVAVADDNGEMPLTDRKLREVKVDMEDLAQVWWKGYRSFITPQVFFEFLRKRYLSGQVSALTSPEEISQIVRTRSEVLETINEWISRGGGAQDALDDSGLFDSLAGFLKRSTDEDTPASSDNITVRQATSTLEHIRKTVYAFFLSQTMRPSSHTISEGDSTTNGVRVYNYGPEPPDVNQIDPEELVNNLDAMAAAAFRNVAEEDLLTVADLLEVQSADRTGWCLPREPSSLADEVEIQFMDGYIIEVEPSSFISELSQDSLYRLLPPSVRSCIRAFGILRKWLLSKLVAHRLGLHARQARFELMLRAIEVCRLRSATSGPSNRPLTERSCTRSFVETVLTATIVSVESRMHHRAWQLVASSRGTSCDTLLALLSRPATTSVTARTNLTVDIGWLMERMLEIISTPDILESPSQESVNLVNFDKRRSLLALISSTITHPARRGNRRHDVGRRDLERLNHVEKEAHSIHFDLRGIREEAQRESAQAAPSMTPTPKKVQRPFQGLVAQQQEKNKRDRYLKDRLSREKRQEQHRIEKREEYLNWAMNPRRNYTATQRQHRNKKSVSSAFFSLMRPISSAFSSESVPFVPVKRTPAELDFAPSHKPSLVLSVVDARVSHFVNNERSFTFQLDTDDGGHYLLQAIDKVELKKWMDTIENVSKAAAKRRLTYLGQNSKMQLSDDLLSKPGAAAQGPDAVYGVDLQYLLEREAEGGEVQPGAIPSVIERLIAEVENRGLSETGIYRLAGSHSEVNSFRDAINRGEWPIEKTTDINTVCDLIKSWFRVLPGGVFPASSYTEIMAAAGLEEVDLDTRISAIRKVVHDLSDANFDLLRRIIEHLEKVTDYEESNHMTAESLATVFSPNFLRSPTDDLGGFFANMKTGHRVTKLLIAHCHTIFDTDVEHDLEGDLDHEREDFDLDEPILEEDEEAENFDDPHAPGESFLGISAEHPTGMAGSASPESIPFPSS